MIVLLNGKFVPEEKALVSVLDRGFLYGDGLFETMRVMGLKPFRWEEHMLRLHAGADYLGIRIPCSSRELLEYAEGLCRENKCNDALMRITVSRGIGSRGYSPKGAERASVVMTVHPLEGQKPGQGSWRLMTSSIRLPANEPLAQFKTCNKLPQIMAKSEADKAGAEEALLSNTDGYLVEGASSNLFWVMEGVVCTSPLSSGVLAGVTREVVRELCARRGIGFRESNVRRQELVRADAVFLSLSSRGVVETTSLDRSVLKICGIVKLLQEDYRQLEKGSAT